MRLPGLASVIAALLAAGCNTAGNRTARPEPQQAAPHAGEVTWKLAITGQVRNAALVDRGNLYFTTFDELFPKLSRLYAVDTRTGREKWTFQPGVHILTSPALAGELVFFGTADGNLYALHRTSGEVAWTFRARGPVWSTAVSSREAIYFGSWDGSLYSLDLETGQEKWQYDAGSRIWSSPHIAGGTVLFGSEDGHLHAVDAGKGRARWKVKTGGPIRSTPASADGTVYFGSHDARLYAVDLQTGLEKWEFATGDAIISKIAVSQGTLLFCSLDNYVFAIDAANGREQWKVRTTGGPTAPVIAGKLVYFGSYEAIVAVELDSGRERFRFVPKGTVHAPPAVSEANIYFGLSDGYFYALR
jgi:outer membrane protein assembly factor BamB